MKILLEGVINMAKVIIKEEIKVSVKHVNKAFEKLEEELSSHDGGWNGFYERPLEIQTIYDFINQFKDSNKI